MGDEQKVKEVDAVAIIIIGDDGCETVLVESEDMGQNVKLIGAMRALTSQLNVRLLASEIDEAIHKRSSLG